MYPQVKRGGENESLPPSKRPHLEEMTKEEQNDVGTIQSTGPEWNHDSTFNLTPTINYQLFQVKAQWHTAADIPRIVILKSPNV